MRSYGFKLIGSMLAAALVFCTLPVTPAYAGMISTQDVVAHTTAMQDRERINAVLTRDDVVAQLEKHGVSLADAQARVAALSDAEARMMADRLDQMPAGANNVVGALVTVFIILLVTDLLGLTNVFPFIRR